VNVPSPTRPWIRRRAFIAGAASMAVTGWGRAPALARVDAGRPAIPWGVQAGDAAQRRAVVWSATDRPARMVVEYATSDRFVDARRAAPVAALPETGHAAKVILTGLPAGQDIFYRVRFQDLRDLAATSAPVTGRFRSAPADGRDVSFAWSADTAGQGWGIDPDRGGMKIYEVMRRLQPDFFVHSGDMIYADNPIPAQIELPAGAGVWRNATTPEKAKVAETIDEFRGNYRYNLMDEHVRRFNAEVLQYVQWDDHEVIDNWFPERVLDDARYTEKRVALLAARARRAMLEFTPFRIHPVDGERIYRAVRRGPLLDLFLIDMRSYRRSNGDNVETELTDRARMLGREQAHWLKHRLLASKATWKVIAADMPLGLVVHHDFVHRRGSDGVAQGDGPALGRELEIAEILRFIKHNGIRNVVWITADVHYCATHRYDPTRAQFTDFAPFYEFVSGPLHAGGFGPAALDNTFGPQVVFSKHPGGRVNVPPTEGALYFGHVTIDGKSREMTVRHRDLAGVVLHQIDLVPEAPIQGTVAPEA
jgi:alkaline phosphatase D